MNTLAPLRTPTRTPAARSSVAFAVPSPCADGGPDDHPPGYEPEPAARQEFAALLRVLRERACLTQEELAERSGLSIRAISDLERGRTSRPHRRSVALLTEALQLEGEFRETFRRTARGSGYASTLPAVSAAVPDPARAARPARPAGTPATTQLLDWMRQLLIEEPARVPRVVELVGPPGPGTSAVVVRAAAQLRQSFPDGQFYVNAAAGQPGPAGLVDRLSRVLGVTPDPDRLRLALGSRRVLLVLDNVTDAAQVRPLLVADGRGAMVVIAPRRLGVLDGAWTIEVPPGRHPAVSR